MTGLGAVGAARSVVWRGRDRELPSLQRLGAWATVGTVKLEMDAGDEGPVKGHEHLALWLATYSHCLGFPICEVGIRVAPASEGC